jgi:hypothetical protein
MWINTAMSFFQRPIVWKTGGAWDENNNKCYDDEVEEENVRYYDRCKDFSGLLFMEHPRKDAQAVFLEV